jgi:hypothetical protein
MLTVQLDINGHSNSRFVAKRIKTGERGWHRYEWVAIIEDKDGYSRVVSKGELSHHESHGAEVLAANVLTAYVNRRWEDDE